MRVSQRAGTAALAALCLGAAAWNTAAQRPAATQKITQKRIAANPAVQNAAPGQMEIIDRSGKAVGLCPLKHTDVKVDISGYVTRVSVYQEFRNPTQEPIEAIYTFPLPSDAAVDDMTMTIGSRIIKSEIKRREEAQQIYETAKANGQAAALLDQERPNIFTQSVANILPGEQVKITIRYVHLLKYDDGEYTFHFPMVVGPRYIGGSANAAANGTKAMDGGTLLEPEVTAPAPSHGPHTPQAATPQVSGQDTHAIVTDAAKVTPPNAPIGTRAGHDISLSVKLDPGMPIASLHSVLHDVSVRPGPGASQIVSLKNEATIPNQDFILKWRVGGPTVQTGVLTYSDANKGGYFTAVIQPPNAPMQGDITPKEMVFVIDQTGSQGGWPIARAKETMRYCIQNLNPGDTFQLIGFNTQLFPCFDKPVPATPETIAKALKFLEPMEGNGGTDIMKSVEYALKLPDDPNRLRIVCYMTDGFVGNDMQIIDCIQKNRGRARMFPFGVGSSVNHFLIDNMAVEGKGAAEYVSEQDDAKTAAERFYRRIAKPMLMNISVDWNGLPVQDVFPKQIPDLFTSGPIILKGRYTQPASGDIIVHGLLRGQEWSQRVHVVLPAQDTDGSQIATLWARDRIEDLQRLDWLGAQQGKPNPSITEDIIKTALEYRLMSQYTSFVAVEQRVINRGGHSLKINVPVEMPKGAFGAQGGAADSLGLASGLQAGYSQVNAFVGVRLNAPAAAAGRFYSYGGAVAANPAVRQKAAETPALKTKLPESITAGDVLTYDADGSIIVRKQDDAGAMAIAAKLHTLLQGLAARVKKDGTNGNLTVPGKLVVKNQNVEVQIAVNSLTKEDRAKLKALGLTDVIELTPGKLLIGWLPVSALEKTAALNFVTRISPPLYAK